MNWNYFNIYGYLSVLLWLGMPLLWLVHSRMRPRGWMCHAALLLGLLAFVLAKINSETHVNRIQPDHSARTAGIDARQEAKRQAAVDSRGDEVADIRFAEDGASDFLDKAGMDEADLKYMDKLDKESAPEWRKEKRSRATEGGGDDGLESMIGGEEEREGVTTDALETASETEPILMSEKDLETANRLDALNLNLIRFMILLGVLMVVIDYLRRANVYREAYLPLPLPSTWINSLTPQAAEVERPEPARRSMPEELAWLTRRGDSFLYLTNDTSMAELLPETLPRFARSRGMVDLLRVSGKGGEIDDDFVFETLWYGRSSFVVDSKARSVRMLDRFIELLKERKTTRARTHQTVHVVWDLDTPMPESTRQAFVNLGGPAGFSLFMNKHLQSTS